MKKEFDKENILFIIVAVILILYAVLCKDSKYFNKKEENKKEEIVTKEIKVIEENTCSILTQFYEDDNYLYTFGCNLVYISVNDKVYNVVDALKEGIISIKDLDNNGFLFNRTVKGEE